MATEDTGTGGTGRQVADNLRRLREARSLSLRALSERVRELGGTLSADAINKIENGRTLPPGTPTPKQVRRVDSDDLVALALALNVSPLDLLLPPRADGRVCNLTTTHTLTARAAWLWALGRRPAMDWEPGGGASLGDPSADPAMAKAAFERDLEFSRQRTEYMRLSLPPEIRQADDHPLVHVATQLRDFVEDVAVAPGDRDDRLRWIRMAKRRVDTINSSLEEVAEVLETGDGLDELKAQFPGLVSHVAVQRDEALEDISNPKP
ncbi:helix-turn-helix domain-containing protein [Kitasatospora sp. NPDC058162]|uniref:helix-turn-helix domain-containing protein n=1 Tax=Kitasatospora sp. NPDC058162 TaxID=3346362 RepID=UPI0036DDB5AA